MITPEEIKAAEDKFLNRRVIIKNAVKTNHITRDSAVVGTLHFLGYNKWFSSWGLCATVDWYPVQNVKLEDISLAE